MPIDANILITYGAAVNRYKKNTIIFQQDDMAKFYYQILEGQVKTFNLNSNFKEFVQGIFNDGDSFGEPALLIQEPYASNAVTTRDAVILKLPRTIFLQILEENPEIQKSMLCTFAQKLYDKAVSARMLNNQAPEERILDFLGYFKKKSTTAEDKILIPYTRQELANLTGLRIETVIRTLRKLSETNKVDIINHKVYY
jgi:CRP-like cAMP-binding protein